MKTKILSLLFLFSLSTVEPISAVRRDTLRVTSLVAALVTGACIYQTLPFNNQTTCALISVSIGTMVGGLIYCSTNGSSAEGYLEHASNILMEIEQTSPIISQYHAQDPRTLLQIIKTLYFGNEAYLTKAKSDLDLFTPRINEAFESLTIAKKSAYGDIAFTEQCNVLIKKGRRLLQNLNVALNIINKALEKDDWDGNNLKNIKNSENIASIN